MDSDQHLGPITYYSDDGKRPKPPPYTTIHQALVALKPKLQAINNARRARDRTGYGVRP